MTEIEHEGKTFVLKSEIENIIQTRVSKVAARASEAEQQLKEAQSKMSEMEKHVSSSDMLAAQVNELKEQLTSSQNRYDRFSTISKHGLVNPDMVDTIEYLYEKSQKNAEEKIEFSSWLDGQVSNPEEAHVMLRPHLKAMQAEAAVQAQAPSQAEVSAESPGLPQIETPSQIPSSNNGARVNPDNMSLQNARFNDLEWYSNNREQIMAEFKSKRRR